MGKTWAVNTAQARVMTPRRLDRITMSRTDDRINKTNCSRSAREALLWRRIRVASVGATVAGITVLGSLMLSSQQVASAATPLSAAVVPVAVGSDNPPAPTASMPADMPGMDMSGSSPAPTEAPMPQDMPGMDMGGSKPAPTEAPMPQDMPGMDMGGSSPAPTEAPMPQDMPGMDMGGSSHGAAANRPLAPVLGTFGGGTAAVLLTAGMLRRKDQGADLVKRAARISGRGKK
jgi:hypothetical protein